MKKLFFTFLMVGSSLNLAHAQNPTASEPSNQEAQNDKKHYFQMEPQKPVIEFQQEQGQQIQPAVATQGLFQSTSPAKQRQGQAPGPVENYDKTKGVYYYVDYDPSSIIKTVPLKNNTLDIKVFYYGNPEGHVLVKTDEYQTFNFNMYKENKSLTLEVLSISDQAKYKAHCSGIVTPGFTKVMIKCDPHPKHA